MNLTIKEAYLAMFYYLADYYERMPSDALGSLLGDMNLFKDVNLSSIEISKDGKNITFNFLDMFEGKLLSIVKCYNANIFNYQNIFEGEGEDDGLACYVGEVNCHKFKKNDTRLLADRKFKFSNSDLLNYIRLEYDLCHLNIESGEISIDVLCKKIEKDNKLILITD